MLALNILLGNLRHFAQETRVAKTSVQTATKLKLEPFKTTVVHEVQSCDPTYRVNSCNRIFHSVHDGKIDSHVVFFSDNSGFHLHRK